MKKQKSIIIVLSLLCTVLLIATLTTTVSYKKVLKSSKRPSGETYTDHQKLTEKFDSFTALGTKYIRADESYNLPENLTNTDQLGSISDFDPSFKKHIYSVDGIIWRTMQDKNILIAWFTNGDKYYFIPENMKEQYK